jgi:hypothetical protein
VGCTRAGKKEGHLYDHVARYPPQVDALGYLRSQWNSGCGHQGRA